MNRFPLNLSRRRVLQAGLMVAGALTNLKVIAASDEPAKVAIGTASVTLQYLPVYVAIKKGFFAANGIELDLINTQSGPRTRQALAAGQIMMGFSAVADAPALSVAGRDTVLVYGIDHRMAWANVLVRKEDYQSGRIRSVSDLSGLTIAVTQPQSAAWASMLELASNAHLKTPPKFQSLGDLGSMLAALKAKRVDATAATVEMLNQTDVDGWAVPIFSSADEAAWQKYLGGDTPGVGGYVLRKTIEQDSANLQHLITALVKGTDFIFGNSAATIASIVQLDYFPSFSQQSLEKSIAFYKATIYSKDNLITPVQYARSLKVFGGGRLFTEVPAKSQALSYDGGVDMNFVKKSRAL